MRIVFVSDDILSYSKISVLGLSCYEHHYLIIFIGNSELLLKSIVIHLLGNYRLLPQKMHFFPGKFSQ